MARHLAISNGKTKLKYTSYEKITSWKFTCNRPIIIILGNSCLSVLPENFPSFKRLRITTCLSDYVKRPWLLSYVNQFRTVNVVVVISFIIHPTWVTVKCKSVLYIFLFISPEHDIFTFILFVPCIGQLITFFLSTTECTLLYTVFWY
jgi:hypothetical protein